MNTARQEVVANLTPELRGEDSGAVDMDWIVSALLVLPFERALEGCLSLRRHIDSQENSTDIASVFRDSWGPGAPQDLREALGKVLEDEEVEHLHAMGVWALLQSTQAPAETVQASSTLAIDTEMLIDVLLTLPFEKALEGCMSLRQHIDRQEDAVDVEQEFQVSWGSDAPEMLRDVLGELLAEEDDFESLALWAILQSTAAPSPVQEDLQLASELARKMNSSEDEEADTSMPGLECGPLVVQRAVALKSFLSTPEHATIEMGGWLPGETAGPQSQSVDDLLQLPFHTALHLSSALREFFESFDDEAVASSMKAEFTRNWGIDAPSELRDFLSTIIACSDENLLEPRHRESAQSERIKSRL